MDIRQLPFGEISAPETDCIRLYIRPDRQVRLEGSALDGEESVTIVGGALYPSEDEAEAAGLAWADGHGVQTLHVSRLDADELRAESDNS